MRPYTFYLHDMGRPNPVFDFVHCDGEEEAGLPPRGDPGSMLVHGGL